MRTRRRRALIPVRFLLPLLAAAAASACSDTSAPTAPKPASPSDSAAPAIQREMRGLWIATVANIDWPSRPTLTDGQQRAELDDILDRASGNGFNAVFLHVRPASDAVYNSAIEPWAAMLTGTQGKDPGYDPLSYAVTAAHARGLEIHAWINPFRAGNSKDSASLAPSHLFNTRRSLVRVYGTQLWIDPGEPEVQDHVMRVVSDIVQRYDIDGVHADDYFYPYQENDAAGRLIDFPDSGSYARSGSTLTRADWRRANVDRFIERMYREVHALAPTIKVGISPFGIWRPGNPAGVSGLDAYATIYADSRKWLQQGWVDYLAPQLYWAISAPQQSFPALLDWWLAQSTLGRHVWPGLAAYRVADGTTSAFGATEIPDQIRLTRTRPAGTGHLLYNTTTTLKKSNGAVAASISTLYASRALVPAVPWLDATAPATPGVSVTSGVVQVIPGAGEPPRWWVVRSRAGGVWTTRVLFGEARSATLDRTSDRVLLTAVDRAGNASGAASWQAP
jgi:uncharacterized lipoprotein YddW (UPF0748 family)